MIKSILWSVLTPFFLVACSTTPHSGVGSHADALKKAIAGAQRTPENKARDVYRHPFETLSFFEVEPEMTVVEIWPSGGWYTEILSSYLAEKGQYIAAVNRSGPAAKYHQKLADWMKVHPELSNKILVVDFDPVDHPDLLHSGLADRVLTFRNYHNWQKRHGEEAAMRAFFNVLKPGGILGIVEHRENPNKAQDPEAKSGYVREDLVIQMAESVGFKLLAKSEINANPRDTKDYKNGVWALPPVLSGDPQDRAKFLAIGESDRMTLKFMKPK